MLKNNQKLKCKPEKLLKKNVPEKEVELCLEVEMDDEVKDIITCPGKYGSTLLDVTVIKPKDIDKLCTSHKKTMSSDEVRKFIASMNLEGNIKEKIHPTKERDHNETKSFGDYTKKTNTAEKQKRDCGHAFFDNVKKIYTTDDTASELFSNRHENHKVKQIYAAPKTFLDLNNMFECKKKKRRDHNEKLNSPCLCQNCAIVGLVTESQKKPFASEMMYDPRETSQNPRKDSREDHRKRKHINFEESGNHFECQYYFKHLNDKIKNLEARIAQQEEKSVPKDYFRRIVTKLVAHITKLTVGSQTKVPCDEPHKKCKESRKYPDKYENYHQRYVVNTVLVDDKNTPPEKENPVSHKKPPTTTGTTNANQLFWKWGEEILRPGIDLKNKIILLLEDTLDTLKKTKERTKEEEINHFVDEFSSNLYKTVHEVPERDMKAQSTREDTPKPRNFAGSEENDRSRKKFHPSFGRKDEPISVEYINSQILKWEDTQTTFKFESSDMDSVRAADLKNDLYRAEFMKTLLNTKEEDKVKLWNSIWNQASANGQTKKDKVTIQLPDRKDKNKNIEILYSLGQLEALLLRRKGKIK